ncbi:MAG: hypothetical protein Kapaf2KO_11520 [Candidatus Kapaibacteriales bacterium]
MNYKVKTIIVFERQAKKLIKKYPSLKYEIKDLVHVLKSSPQLGTSLGNNCYKIRIAIKSKGKGKSGGGRIISNILVDENEVYLLSIYDQANKDDLSVNELKELLKYIPN